MMYDKRRVLSPHKAGRVSLPLSFYEGQLKAAGADINNPCYMIPEWLHDGKSGGAAQNVVKVTLYYYWLDKSRVQRHFEKLCVENLTATLAEVLA